MSSINQASNDVENTSVKSSKKRRLLSKVWDEFVLLEKHLFEDNRERAKCMHCDDVLISDSKGGTTSLSRHLERCKIRKNKSKGEVSGKKIDQEKYREIQALAVIRHGYPFSWAEHEANRAIHLYLNDNAKPICRNTMKKECWKLHYKLKDQLKDSFKKTFGRICLTTDMWTSCTTQGYLCLTAHYIDNDWKLNNKILNFCHLPPPHTSIAMYQQIHTLLKEWGIDKKIFTITVDNASSMGKMQKMLGEQLCAQSSLLCNGEFFHIRCCAHILNLIVQEGIKVLDDSVVKIRETVKYISGSESRKIKFDECVELYNGGHGTNSKSLWMDVPTRWNSTYLMLERATFYRGAIENLASIDPNYEISLTNEEWCRVEKICNFLKPFYEITKLFSGTEYPTANLYFENVCKIQLCIMNASKSPNYYVQEMGVKMKVKFDKYWEEYNVVLSIASILDPRYKLKLMKHCYKIVVPLEFEQKCEDVQNQLFKIFKEYSPDVNPPQVVRHSGDDVISTFEYYEDESHKSELDSYLDEPKYTFKVNEKFDVLAYWKENEQRYPRLSTMARDILAIPITSVASESTFSMGGRILNKRRTSLLAENAQALVTTRSWLYGYEDYIVDTEESMNDLGKEVIFVGLSKRTGASDSSPVSVS